MNRRCAFALPATRLAKSASESDSVTIGGMEIRKGSSETCRGKRTTGLGADTVANLARLLQVDVPALGVASLVLEGKRIDPVALLDSVLAVGIAGVERGVDGLEGLGRGKLVCRRSRQPPAPPQPNLRLYVPFLRDMLVRGGAAGLCDDMQKVK